MGRKRTLQELSEGHEAVDETFDEDAEIFYLDMEDELGGFLIERDEKIEYSVPGWYIEGEGMGWRSQIGTQTLSLSTYDRPYQDIARDFLRAVLPRT